jgi:hypothetical protein
VYVDGYNRLVKDPEEPIEGCTLHDVGRMMVQHADMTSMYGYLRGLPG